jgi:hypothetical protein
MAKKNILDFLNFFKLNMIFYNFNQKFEIKWTREVSAIITREWRD